MDIEFGFVIVVFVELLIVAPPAILLTIKLWHAGTIGRFLAIATILLVGVLSFFLSMPDAEIGTGSFDGRVVIFLAMWGYLFYFFLVLYFLFHCGRFTLLHIPLLFSTKDKS